MQLTRHGAGVGANTRMKQAALPGRLTGPSSSIRQLARQPAVPGAPSRRDAVLVQFKDSDAEPSMLERIRHIGARVAGKAPVVFQLSRRCNFGEAWGVVGSAAELGGWDTTKPLVMQWAPGDKWYAVLYLPRDADLEFKYVLLDANKNNTFKAWANDVTGANNLKLIVKAGNHVDNGAGALTRVFDESLITATSGTTTTSTTSSVRGYPGDTSTGTLRPPSDTADTSRNGVRPIVSAVSGSMGASVAIDTQTQRVPPSTNNQRPTPSFTPSSRAYDRPGSNANSVLQMSGTLPDRDPADPPNQMVTLGPQKAGEPNMQRHIAQDTLTTDKNLAAAAGVHPSQVDTHNLSHIDRSSLGYRSPRHDVLSTGGNHSGPTAHGSPAFTSPSPAHTTSAHSMSVPSPQMGTPSGTPTAAPFTAGPPLHGSLYAGTTGARTSPATPDIGPFTLGGGSIAANRSHMMSDVAAQDAHTVHADVTGTNVAYPRNEPPVTGEAARTTLAADAGLEMPVSATTATVSTIMANIGGGDEEMPEAPLMSGIIPTTGETAAADTSILNPKRNPMVMAASFITSPVTSFLGKVTDTVSGYVKPSSHGEEYHEQHRVVAGPIITGLYGMPYQVKQRDVTAHATSQHSGDMGEEHAPESGSMRDERPWQRQRTPGESAGEEQERASGSGVHTRSAPDQQGATTSPESGTEGRVQHPGQQGHQGTGSGV